MTSPSTAGAGYPRVVSEWFYAGQDWRVVEFNDKSSMAEYSDDTDAMDASVWKTPDDGDAADVLPRRIAALESQLAAAIAERDEARREEADADEYRRRACDQRDAALSKLHASAGRPDRVTLAKALRRAYRKRMGWTVEALDQVEHEPPTEATLAEADAALALLAPAQETDHSLCHREGCSLKRMPVSLASCGCWRAPASPSGEANHIPSEESIARSLNALGLVQARDDALGKAARFVRSSMERIALSTRLGAAARVGTIDRGALALALSRAFHNDDEITSTRQGDQDWWLRAADAALALIGAAPSAAEGEKAKADSTALDEIERATAQRLANGPCYDSTYLAEVESAIRSTGRLARKDGET